MRLRYQSVYRCEQKEIKDCCDGGHALSSQGVRWGISLCHYLNMFKLYDKIRLRKTSQFIGQNKGVGEIVGLKPNNSFEFSVRWSNGSHYNYNTEDLEYAQPAWDE